ncbi:hypothetical protein X975_22725, partial [Stegodyphus mimosarum]
MYKVAEKKKQEFLQNSQEARERAEFLLLMKGDPFCPQNRLGFYKIYAEYKVVDLPVLSSK